MISAVSNFTSYPVSYNELFVPLCLPQTTLNLNIHETIIPQDLTSRTTCLFDKTLKLQWYDEDRENTLDGDSYYDQTINPKTQCDMCQWRDEMRHTTQRNREFNRNLKFGWGLAEFGSQIYCNPKCLNGDWRMCAVSTVINGLKNSTNNDIALFRDDEPNSIAPKVKMVIADVVDTTIRLGNTVYYYPKCMAGSLPMCAAFSVLNDIANTIKNDYIQAGGSKQNSILSRVKERISKTIDSAVNTHFNYAISQICFKKRWKDCALHIMGNYGFAFLKSKL